MNKPHKSPEGYLNMQETCDFLMITRITLYRWRKTGKLKGYKNGCSPNWLYKKTDLDQLLDPQLQAAIRKITPPGDEIDITEKDLEGEWDSLYIDLTDEETRNEFRGTTAKENRSRD